MARSLPVVLPHELLAHLSAHGHLAELESSEVYWRHFQNQGVTWARDQEDLSVVPLFLYGDDTRYNKQDKATVIYLGAVLDERSSSMRTHWPLCVVREA